VFGGKWLTITMPELADFADQRFSRESLLRFRRHRRRRRRHAAARRLQSGAIVKTPDVGGTIFLDPKTYQLRITLVSLVNLTKQLRSQISGQSIKIAFKDAIDGVPVIDVVSSVVFPSRQRQGAGARAVNRRSAGACIRFLRGKP
jgi:hypothetical protein